MSDPVLQVNLTGKVALVTGASRGIGRACVEALSRCGARVVAVARSLEGLGQLASAVPGVETWAMDTRDREFIERLLGMESLDILVNNVGGNRPQPFLEVDRETLDWMIDVNIRQAFLTSQAAARVILRAGSKGSIVHMSSQMGHVGSAGRTAYCAAKHAIEGLTKAMAVELAPHGIRVNAVAPTFIDTDLVRPMLEDLKFKEFVLGMIPLGRVGSVEDVAAAVLYLASDAAGLVTGSSLRVDGGWTAR